MPRYAVTSNLVAFPPEALAEASRIISALSYDHKLRKNTDELCINYNPETGNVFLSDSEFHIWIVSKSWTKKGQDTLVLLDGTLENGHFKEDDYEESECMECSGIFTSRHGSHVCSQCQEILDGNGV